ncbi:hypothetical protein EVC13_056 [Rhizobium phage RHph_I65]|nr:hypothetical protein EVC13_056 [Rhizobium phage RHph_I65]
MVDLKQRIDQLPATLVPSLNHEFPAMKDGLTVKLKVQQIIDLLVNGAPSALDTWLELVAAIQADQTGIAALTTAVANRVRFDAAQTLTALQQAQAIANIGASDLAADYIQGMKLSNDPGFPTTRIVVAPGRVKAGSVVVSNLTNLTKRMDQTWVAGNNGGGMDTGTVLAGDTLFLYALQKTADGSFDWVFSKSATVAGVNTSLLSGYTVVAMIGVLPRIDNGPAILPFVMNDGDDYTLVTPTQDATNLAVGTTNQLVPVIRMPAGIKVKAKLRGLFNSASTTNSCLVHSPDQGTLVAGGGASGGNIGTPQVASGYTSTYLGPIWTDTNRNVRAVAGASGTLNMWCDGFIFPLGRK